jgi:hypothetical protein
VIGAIENKIAGRSGRIKSSGSRLGRMIRRMGKRIERGRQRRVNVDSYDVYSIGIGIGRRVGKNSPIRPYGRGIRSDNGM